MFVVPHTRDEQTDESWLPRRCVGGRVATLTLFDSELPAETDAMCTIVDQTLTLEGCRCSKLIQVICES